MRSADPGCAGTGCGLTLLEKKSPTQRSLLQHNLLKMKGWTREGGRSPIPGGRTNGSENRSAEEAMLPFSAEAVPSQLWYGWNWRAAPTALAE